MFFKEFFRKYVYVVQEGCAYEGGQAIAVFESYEAAEKYIEKLITELPNYRSEKPYIRGEHYGQHYDNDIWWQAEAYYFSIKRFRVNK